MVVTNNPELLDRSRVIGCVVAFLPRVIMEKTRSLFHRAQIQYRIITECATQGHDRVDSLRSIGYRRLSSGDLKLTMSPWRLD